MLPTARQKYLCNYDVTAEISNSIRKSHWDKRKVHIFPPGYYCFKKSKYCTRLSETWSAASARRGDWDPTSRPSLSCCCGPTTTLANITGKNISHFILLSWKQTTYHFLCCNDHSLYPYNARIMYVVQHIITFLINTIYIQLPRWCSGLRVAL